MTLPGLKPVELKAVIRKSFWKQFLKTTVVPTIYVADSEIQPEGRCISERLEKIVGKRQPVVEKIRFQKR